MEEATVVDAYFSRFVLPEDLHSALQACRSIAYIETQEELDELVFGPTHSGTARWRVRVRSCRP